MGSLGALALCLLRLLLLGLQRSPLPGARAQSAAGECDCPAPLGPRALSCSLGGESWVRWAGEVETEWPESGPSLRTQLLRPGMPGPAPVPPGPLVALLSCLSPPPPGGSNFPRLLRIFPLAASHLSEPVTRVFWGGGLRRRFSPGGEHCHPGSFSGCARSWSGEHRSLAGPGCKGGGFFFLLGDTEEHPVLF